MTRCNKSEVNLKSTVYNQNGQNYFEQLTAYNSMNAHLRRVLLAKCVVDARNKSYMLRRRKQCKDIDYKPICAKPEVTDDVIDRLAYDTLHHPADILRMTYNTKYLCHNENQKYFTDNYNYDVICSQSRFRDHVIYPGSSLFKQNKFPPFTSNNENIKHRTFMQSKAVNTKSTIKIEDISEPRFGDNSIIYETASDFITQEINQYSPEENSRCNENSECIQEPATVYCDQGKDKKDDDEKYAKFVYDITREIINKGLYTDQEIQEVFDKHLERNKTILNKNKMLYEIYQLKFALNVVDDSDDEELEDLIHTQKLINVSELRPPTPPKVLNENKLIEKLKSYDTTISRESETSSKKSVVLIDANPELVLTERDIITSLIEANINPAKTQKICKQLFYKSKDTVPLHKGIQSCNDSSMHDEGLYTICDNQPNDRPEKS